MSSPEPVLTGGLIATVAPDSLAHELGVQQNDILLAVNGEQVEDVIDVQYYASEYHVQLLIQRGEQQITLQGVRKDMQPLGLEFLHPTFDIDIRRCNNLCEFCFVLQMAPRFRRTLYIKDDDYRYSFLFGHYVTLTNLSEHDEWRIVEQHLSPLYVSVHVTDLDARRAYLRNANAPDIMDQLRWLIEEGIEVHTQIVVTPQVNDGELLEQSVRDLAALYPGVKTISIVPIGLTKQHKYGLRPNTREESESILDRCANWQADFQMQLGVRLVYATDEWYLVAKRPIPAMDEYDGLDLTENGLGQVRRFIEDWEEVKAELVGQETKIKNLTLATGTLFAPILVSYAAEFSLVSKVSTSVIAITNTKLGDSITVAGLLMGTDVIAQLQGIELGDVVILPRVMFDHPDGVALDDVSPLDVARALDRPVALVDMMGDLVDVIYGKPSLFFHPSSDQIISTQAILKDGGWAVEKYL